MENVNWIYILLFLGFSFGKEILSTDNSVNKSEIYTLKNITNRNESEIYPTLRNITNSTDSLTPQEGTKEPYNDTDNLKDAFSQISMINNTDSANFTGNIPIGKITLPTNSCDIVIQSNLSLESLSDLVFRQAVVDSLITRCAPGHWCLQQDPFSEHGLLKLADLCQKEVDWKIKTNRCDTQIDIIMGATLKLYCEAYQTNHSTNCLKSIMKLSHVAYAEMLSQQKSTRLVCSEGNKQEACQGSCKTFAQDIHCTCKTCSHSRKMFERHPSFKWLFRMENKKKKCSLKSADCSLYEDMQTNTPMKMFQGVQIMTEDKLKVMIAFIIFMVTILAVIIVIYICVHGNKKLEYARDHVHYTKLENYIERRRKNTE